MFECLSICRSVSKHFNLFNGFFILFICLNKQGIPNSYGHKKFSFTCQPVDPTNTEPWMMRLLYVTYGYYMTKYLDLFDTVCTKSNITSTKMQHKILSTYTMYVHTYIHT